MAHRGLVIDTNLLLLLVIGAVENGRFISKSNRLNGFNELDYQIIVKIISAFDQVYLTSYIAAETSNLIDLTGHAKKLAYGIARLLFSEFKQIKVCIKNDCSDENFLRFGLTDASIISLATKYTILTNDNRMLPALYCVNEKNVLPFDVARTLY